MAGIVRIDEDSKTPKYRQIINSILAAIGRKELMVGTRLPSVNRLLIEFDISRDTVVKAYDGLKRMGVVESIPGKGFYVKSENFRQRYKIFLLFNKLSAHKKIIYDSFVNTLGYNASIDFYIYNNDFKLFRSLLLSAKDDDYSHYVIIPHFLGGGVQQAALMIDDLPKEKLLILDNDIQGISGHYSAVYQDFYNDIYGALQGMIGHLEKYENLNLIFPGDSYHPFEIVNGYMDFCKSNDFKGEVIEELEETIINRNEAYLSVTEDDLVALIKKIKIQGLEVGREVGIVSYNETPLKEILLDGITVISTDFTQLGKTAAQIILDGSSKQVSNPFSFIVRNSL